MESASDWKSASDPKTGRTYWYHRKTRVSTWVKPVFVEDRIEVRPEQQPETKLKPTSAIDSEFNRSSFHPEVNDIVSTFASAMNHLEPNEQLSSIRKLFLISCDAQKLNPLKQNRQWLPLVRLLNLVNDSISLIIVGIFANLFVSFTGSFFDLESKSKLVKKATQLLEIAKARPESLDRNSIRLLLSENMIHNLSCCAYKGHYICLLTLAVVGHCIASQKHDSSNVLNSKFISSLQKVYSSPAIDQVRIMCNVVCAFSFLYPLGIKTNCSMCVTCPCSQLRRSLQKVS